MVDFVADLFNFPVILELDSGFLELWFRDFGADHH
jgi:hypothetical protein